MPKRMCTRFAGTSCLQAGIQPCLKLAPRRLPRACKLFHKSVWYLAHCQTKFHMQAREGSFNSSRVCCSGSAPGSSSSPESWRDHQARDREGARSTDKFRSDHLQEKATHPSKQLLAVDGCNIVEGSPVRKGRTLLSVQTVYPNFQTVYPHYPRITAGL